MSYQCSSLLLLLQGVFLCFYLSCLIFFSLCLLNCTFTEILKDFLGEDSVHLHSKSFILKLSISKTPSIVIFALFKSWSQKIVTSISLTEQEFCFPASLSLFFWYGNIKIGLLFLMLTETPSNFWIELCHLLLHNNFWLFYQMLFISGYKISHFFSSGTYVIMHVRYS